MFSRTRTGLERIGPSDDAPRPEERTVPVRATAGAQPRDGGQTGQQADGGEDDGAGDRQISDEQGTRERTARRAEHASEPMRRGGFVPGRPTTGTITRRQSHR